jgi:hypothetical protein
MPNIITKVEKQRGCGFRKPGAMYFVGESAFSECCKLPYELLVCRCCGHGHKPSRGFSWIMSDIFFPGDCRQKKFCILSCQGIQMGLMWVGEKYYHKPADFTREALAIGISKRIAQIPKEFQIGKTFIALAHHRTHAVFMVFRPTAIEYVVTGTETDEQLEKLAKRGLTLVKVEHEGEQINLSL